MVSLLVRTFTVLVLFFSAFSTGWLEPADTSLNPLRPPEGWRFGNKELARRNDCEPDADDPDVPDCRTLCGSNCVTTNARAIRRQISNVALPPQGLSVLSKRAFVDVAQGNLGQYLFDQYNENPDPRYGSPIRLIDNDPDADQLNIVVQKQLQDQPFAVGTDGLCGCTVVTIISNQAVYMGHFFEDPSWGKATNFRNMVLNFFGGTGNPVGEGDKIDPALFPEAQTRVYIMTPRKENGQFTSSNYRGKVPQLITSIRAVVGQNVPIAVYNYVPVDCNAPDDEFSDQTGISLFQYDPTADAAGNPGWRLFYEQHLFRSSDPAPGPDAVRGIPDV
ncbi:hypothetical protein F5884DRAFT_898539 [Xylogone sp. PMI_703]|nr:hypothetical protein F5884DRAFT_898539 [Xylogone sp. PMI_703]